MPMWNYPNNYGMGYGFGGMLLGVVVLLLCLTALGLLIWYALSLIELRERRHLLDDGRSGALETLRRRYARGEIDEPAFLRMRELLTPQEDAMPPEPVAPR